MVFCCQLNGSILPNHDLYWPETGLLSEVVSFEVQASAFAWRDSSLG